MAFPALLDTNVLFSATLNDTLLRLAEEGAFRPLWSDEILTELSRVLVREAELPTSAAERRVAHMRAAFPMAEVTDYQALIDVMACHPKDRHVLAAAIRGGAQVLVTFDLDDFPEESVQPHDITVVSPDAFLLDQLDLYPAKVGRALVGQISEAKRPPLSMGELLGRLGRAGVPAFAEEARRHEFA
jgi:predicted nucleic acid-binding protein